jgi:gliding motility-associated-like protein
MKKIILSLILCLPLIFSAQINNKNAAQQLKLKSLEAKKKADAIKPTVVLGTQQYDLLKSEGKIAHYEVVINEGKVISYEKTAYNSAGKVMSSTLTPCDIVPPGTISSFGAPLDDQTTPLINLPFTFCFYGNNYTQVRMSSNGNIQFPPTNNAAFSSTGFPAPNDRMIAPFWADLDNRGTGTFSYDIFPTYAVFTWGSVGYFNSHANLTNDFQMVITDGLDPILPPGKNVGFYYGTMQWTTGDASSGVGGFPNPAITPNIPATVGANAGNGVDYFLIGRFGQPGAFYDGPLGVNDGVSWLDGKVFYFNVCPPIGANNEPIPTLIGYCDTLKVCGNDTLFVKNTFIAPEVSQSVTVTATAPTLGTAFSYSVLPNTNSTDIYMIVDGSIATGGYHMVTMTAVDNGVPAQTSVQNFIVYVNQAAINNLNGTMVLTPTIGACPGQTVSASVTVSGGVPDSYLWSNNETTSSTTFTTVVAADSLIFVTLQSGQCQKTIVGDININPVPVASITGNLSFCSGDTTSTVLTATNTLNPATQGPHSYAWSAASGTLTSNNTSTTAVNQGVYTVTVTNQFGCVSVATTSVTMNQSPSFSLASLNAISGGSVYCVNQDTARIAINFGGQSSANCGAAVSPCVSSNNTSVGSGTGNSSGTDVTPYANLWGNTRHQYLFRASELTAAGLTAGKLSSISFSIASVTGLSNYPNFTIKLKCTSANALNTTFDNAGFTQVYSANTPITAGLNTHNFTTNYIWDGVSNVMIDICHDVALPWTNSSAVYFNTTAFNSVRYAFSDPNPLCGTTVAASTGTQRPNIIFGNCLAAQTGSQFNVVVTPTTGVVVAAAHDSIKFDLPSTAGTTCYTVTLINPLGACSKDTVICVEALQGITQGTLSLNSTSVCPSQTVTINALGTLTSYTLQYTDNSGVQTTTTSPVTFTAPSTVGAYTYTLLATGPCGGTLTAFTNTLNVIQGVTNGTLAVSDNTLCPGSNVTLSALGSLASYTIAYVDASGNTLTSVNAPATFNPESTTSPVFGVHTYSLIAEGPCNGPITVFTNTLDVIQGVTQGTLAVSNNTLCPGSNVTLSALGTLASYTIAYVDASGNTQTSVNNPATFTPESTTSPVFGVHTYSLIAEGPCNGPITVFTSTVDVIQGLTNATLVATPSVVCIGSPVTLTEVGSLSTYTISYNNGSGTVNSVNTPPTFNTAVAGNITYTLMAQGFCSAPINTYTTSVTVNSLLNLTITPMANVIKCLNNSVSLTANVAASSAQPYTYNWSPAVGTNTNSTYVTSTPVTTTFVVTVNGNCANTATASVVVSNFATDINVAIIDSASICANTDLMLNTTTTGGKTPYSFNWTILPDINSVSTTNQLNTQAPGSEGTYTVMVVSTDSCGFTDFDIQLINVLPPCDIIIPNIITPNGDGANDYFKIKNIEYHPNSSLTIFDRWGKKVYSSASYSNEWKGDGLNDGTFFYVLDVPDDKKYSGFFQLLR